MMVIGFAGCARGGKTTAARYMRAWAADHGMRPIIHSFASPMKRAAERIGLSKEKDPDKYRSTLQRWGESRRNPDYKQGVTGPDYWVGRAIFDLLEYQLSERRLYDSLDHLMLNSNHKEVVVLIDDLRYPNEVEMVEMMGGVTIFIDGSGRIKDMDAPYRQHESEKMAMDYTNGKIPDLFDFTILNNKSEAALKKYIFARGHIFMDAETVS